MKKFVRFDSMEAFGDLTTYQFSFIMSSLDIEAKTATEKKEMAEALERINALDAKFNRSGM